MKPSNKSTHIILNMSASNAASGRLLAAARMVNIKCHDVKLNVTSFQQSKLRSYISWDIVLKTRCPLPLTNILSWLGTAFEISGAHIKSPSITLIA